MAKQNNHLGSGLENIFGSDVTDLLDEIQTSSSSSEYGRKAVLKIKDIVVNPYQPRKQFDNDKLNELAASIQQSGVFTPILVRQADKGYQLVTGERRLRASQIAGKEEIPAIIMEFTDQEMMEISLLENIQRENLNVVEEATAYQKLIDQCGYTQQQMAEKLGKSREHVANTLRLLKLPNEVLDYVNEGKLSMGQVRPLITLESTKAKELAKQIAQNNLSVREVESLVSAKQNETKPEKAKTVANPYIKDLTKKLEQKYGTKVKISNNALTIKFNDDDDLNRILQIMDVID